MEKLIEGIPNQKYPERYTEPLDQTFIHCSRDLVIEFEYKILLGCAPKQ